MEEQEKTKSQELLEKATEEGNVPLPFLQLAVQIKDDDGKRKGVKGTGRHTVIFISDKVVKGEDFKTKEERDEVEYTFEESGQKKRHSVPVYNKNGELHYFVQRMAEIKRGETITLEYKKTESSFRGYIEVGKLSHHTAEAGKEELKKEVSKDEIPVVEEEREINVDEIPF